MKCMTNNAYPSFKYTLNFLQLLFFEYFYNTFEICSLLDVLSITIENVELFARYQDFFGSKNVWERNTHVPM